MGRARRARKIAATAAYGGGGVAAAGAALGLIGYAVVRVEGAIARRIVGSPYDNAPEHEGIYGAGIGEPLDLIMLGDSLSAGLGAESGEQTIGAIVAGSVAALTARRVRLTNRAVVGAESTDLERQLGSASTRSTHRLLCSSSSARTTSRIERTERPRCATSRPRSAGHEPVGPRSSSRPAPIWGPSSRCRNRCACSSAAGVATSRQPRRSRSSRRAAGRCLSATSSDRSSRPRRTSSSARTVSIRRRRVMPGRRLPCCPPCAMRSACGVRTRPTGRPDPSRRRHQAGGRGCRAGRARRAPRSAPPRWAGPAGVPVAGGRC